MNLQHLQYIIEIDNCGSISKAAQNLFVSQPYLSKILREVESDYHISIFTRGKNGIILTESGRLFINMAKDLLDQAARFQKTFEDNRDSYRLRVVSGTFSHSIDAFIRMVNSLPDTSLRFMYKETGNANVINDVYTQRADIGVILLSDKLAQSTFELLQARRIEYHKLFENDSWLLTRAGHPLLGKTSPIALDDIYQYNLVVYPQHMDPEIHAAESSMLSDEPVNLFDLNRFRQIITVQSRSALHNIITMTDYIGVGTSPILDQESLYNLASIPLPPELAAKENRNNGYAMYYLHLKDRELPKAARVFITFLENYYGQKSNYGKSYSSADFF